MGLNRFPLKDFTGGWNTRDSPTQLQPSESPLTENVTLTPLGQLQQRKGISQLAEPVVANRMTYLKRWIVGAGATINGIVVSAITGSIWFVDPVARASREIFAGRVEATWDFEPSRDERNVDRLWMVNGVEAPQKWDGRTARTEAWVNPPLRECTMIRSWRNIMVASGNPAFPYRLYASPVGNPEGRFETFIDIGTVDDDQDPITWLDILGDYLIVFKRNSVWAVFDPVTFENRRMGIPGCFDRFQSCTVENRLYFFNSRSVYSVGVGGDIVNEADQIRPVFTGEGSPLDQLTRGQFGRVQLIAQPNNRIMMLAPVNGSTRNNRIYELIPNNTFVSRRNDRVFTSDLVVMRHTFGGNPLTSFRSAVSFEGRLYMVSDTNAALYLGFEGAFDEINSPVRPQHIMAWRGIQEEEPIERIRRINVRHQGRLIVDVYKEFNAENPAFSQQITAPVSADALWEGGEWSGGEWDPQFSVALNRVRPETRARYHAIGFRGTDTIAEQLGMSIFEAEVVYRGGKEH